MYRTFLNVPDNNEASEHEETQGHRLDAECTYHVGQQGAASVEHEGVSEEDVAAVHLQLHVAELRVVHHAAQIATQPGRARLRHTDVKPNDQHVAHFSPFW